MKPSFQVFISSVLAGLCIGFGGLVFLPTDNRIVGSALFTIGLFCVCSFGFHLFTGKVCYALQNDRAYALMLPIIWLGNLIGTGLTAGCASLTRNGPALQEKAMALCQIKLNDSLISLFFLGVLCNIFIYIAVEGFKNNPHELGKYLSLFFGVMVFILAGTEHCVADMFYFWMAGAWSGRAVICVLVISLGNAVGGLLFANLHRLIRLKTDK
ncbi:MAG: formate/nitrite transporter family protein [Oscillospiraceae bacterium]|nr:formate/nitrite transporter family protein [Oscillospiraceae bacterium]